MTQDGEMGDSQGFEILESLKHAGSDVSESVLEEDELIQMHESRERAIFHVTDLVLTQISVCEGRTRNEMHYGSRTTTASSTQDDDDGKRRRQSSRGRRR